MKRRNKGYRAYTSPELLVTPMYLESGEFHSYLLEVRKTRFKREDSPLLNEIR